MNSLQGRIALLLGILFLALWAASAVFTSQQIRSEVESVFDSALQETAQRILPLAVADILENEQQDKPRRLATIHSHNELLTYLVRDPQGRILLRSHDAVPEQFPAWNGSGFRQTETHRIYNEDSLQGSIRISLAEPLAHRQAMIRNIQLSLGLPVLIFMPLALLAIILVIRTSLVSLNRFRDRLAHRDEHDLSLLPTDGLPAEITPIANTLNEVLAKLASAFAAERGFTANAAHELRTPLAGAIAQAQLLQRETQEDRSRQRALDIESTLKRLTVMSERLMQLARAEGSQLFLDRAGDLRPVMELLGMDLSRNGSAGRLILDLPEQPVQSNLDPDLFAILYRNLLENALRHGTAGTPVHVRLDDSGLLSVSNNCDIIPEQVLQQLTRRFERGQARATGSGLGLAIVQAICLRIGTRLELSSPARDRERGFEARLVLPVQAD